MQLKSKKCLVLLVLLIFLIQLTHTVFNKVNWPFCSHNFYYHRSLKVKPIFYVSLKDSLGHIQTVNCRATLPIEGYRCGSIYREVFEKTEDINFKNAYAELVLDRLNNQSWNFFDERFAPVKPTKGSHFISLCVEKHYIDTTDFGKTKQTSLVKVEPLFVYSLEKEAIYE